MQTVVGRSHDQVSEPAELDVDIGVHCIRLNRGDIGCDDDDGRVEAEERQGQRLGETAVEAVHEVDGVVIPGVDLVRRVMDAVDLPEPTAVPPTVHPVPAEVGDQNRSGKGKAEGERVFPHADGGDRERDAQLDEGIHAAVEAKVEEVSERFPKGRVPPSLEGHAPLENKEHGKGAEKPRHRDGFERNALQDRPSQERRIGAEQGGIGDIPCQRAAAQSGVAG